MKKLLSLCLAVLTLTACTDDGRTYVGEHNYYTMEPTEIAESPSSTYQAGKFPRYHVFRAKEWPREDLNDASSYDLPRVQFTWANLSERGVLEKGAPAYTDYEGRVKVWSMKTDGTDLRLVTDLPYEGRSRDIVRDKTSRSPNNRYVAMDAGTQVKVFDIKEQKMIDLPHKLHGPSGYIWAEDSSYLYYRTGQVGRVVYKWDVKTGQVEKTDIHISQTGLIKDGKRYKVTSVYTVVYDENTGEKLQSVRWGEGLKSWQSNADYTSISPEGTVSWGSNRSYGNFSVDITSNTVKPAIGAMQFAIGLNSKFALTNYNAMRMTVKNNQTKQSWKWRALSNNGTRDPAIVYNVSANNGDWFKEAK
ncbi:hypothetical protein [Vibrio campbellii]|uniref:Tricorn protease domain-containing protein n=1 Tax=Vibrio campbellii (strain ATCC BAA-1116) TaxID=2902295 RepID=A7N6M4_VIBC1|nr:hypothetical protein [Vibrio campbellii]ABU74100.1 hypothetical protein VIBHAR_06208 [Vibrio campbellii ATCC BAA-1116]AGU98416.1 hypothetical protein M892_20980 [Vibrio campbellii ATCC BAA-1116]MBT0123077.1 hypothetical protein [Vibrio campbellii]MBT0138129.1 hypothetical protein [Vibrio campbellii]MBT0142867.1 hypothetical protein [Vibrio campbellii]